MGLSKQFFQIYSVLLFLLFYFYKELPILFSTLFNYNNNNNNNNNNHNINTFFFYFPPSLSFYLRISVASETRLNLFNQM